MKKTMITLSVIVICIVIFFGYLAITKPNKMPFIGHFFDKTVYRFSVRLFGIDTPELRTKDENEKEKKRSMLIRRENVDLSTIDEVIRLIMEKGILQ